MFGINSAPEIFQRRLEQLLSPCSNVMNYIDDVIIFGSDEKEHDKNVNEVCEIFKANNVLLNHQKCIWKTNKLKFLGHILSDKGIEVDPEKITTITTFRDPVTKEEVRSFLGLVTYVGKFIPDLATRTEPLRRLLIKENKFVWGMVEKKAFEDLKLRLAEVTRLSYFNPNKKTRLIADASKVALGAVLVQLQEETKPNIISFASRSLSKVEQRYSQTEKESLALVWGVEKFYFYLTGLEFELVTYHKPLEAIFKPTSKLPARIERWLLRLQAYKFKVIYKTGKEKISDVLSRLCQPAETQCFDLEGEHNLLRVIENSIPVSMSISEVAEESTRDEEIIDAMSCMDNNSWEAASSSKLYPFRFELSTVGQILLRGTRIIIPVTLRQKVLELAHEGHPGESVMKRRLRSKVWWPLIDREVEKFVKNCRDCILVSRDLRPAPMSRTQFPTGPWICVATDLLGPLPNSEYILVLIDYYSRYMEIKFLRSISSSIIIDSMKEIFSRLGFPKCLRTDNGRQYISMEFQQYCKTCGIQQIKTPPYWPQANGEVENMNKNLVKRLKIAHLNKENYKEAIQKFMLMYNVTPHGSTGTSPSELMFGRVIRDKIPSIQDLMGDVSDSVERDRDCVSKQKGKETADRKRGAKEIDIEVGNKVYLKNVVFPHKLTPNFDTTEYEVIERKGNVVKLFGGGRTLMRNVAHLKKIPSIPPTMGTQSHSSSLAPETLVSVAAPPDSISSTGKQNSEQSDPPGFTGTTSSGQRLKLKLVNKGGMWQPCSSGTIESEEDSFDS